MAYLQTFLFESFAERRHRPEGDARAVATLLLPVDIGCLYAGDHAREARGASSCTFPRVLSGADRHTRFRRAAELRIGYAQGGKGSLGAEDTKGCKNVSFCTLVGFTDIGATLLERMAGTTRLELATSAVTA